MLSNGDIIEVSITDFGVDGEGVGRYLVHSASPPDFFPAQSGLVVFVAGGVPGDTVLARVSELKKGWVRAEIVEITEYSSARIEPVCPNGDCGGCRFGYVGYETELIYKKKKVNEALKRVGGLDFEIDEIIGMDEPCHYRNKAVYHVAESGAGVQIGFYAHKSNKIVPIDGCVMFPEANKKIIAALKEHFAENGGARGITEITVRMSSHTGEVLIGLTGGKPPKAVNRLAKRIKGQLDGESVFGMSASLEGLTFSAANSGAKTHWGKGFITDKIGGYTFKVSAESFFQVNAKMTRVLYEKAREYACPTGTGHVIDAYCGVGTLALFVSPYAEHVTGIELSRRAVLDAEENAELNGVSHARFMQGDTAGVLSELAADGSRPDTVILDPPRSGCGKGVLPALIKLSPRRIVYVSCAPATLARDLRELCAYGYKAEAGVCVDMFARSAHVESVVLLSRV